MIEMTPLHSDQKPISIYHERQNLLLCALHTLNNLFQSTIFSKENLDNFCESLTKSKLCYNPHRSIFRIGDYDIQVIEYALNSRGFQIYWFDMRNNIEEIELLAPNNKIYGLIINIKSKSFSLSDSHWFAIKAIDNIIYNLDSKLNSPQKMGPAYFGEFLELVKKSNGQIFIVRQNEDNNKEEEEDDKDQKPDFEKIIPSNLEHNSK